MFVASLVKNYSSQPLADWQVLPVAVQFWFIGNIDSPYHIHMTVPYLVLNINISYDGISGCSGYIS